MRKVMMIGLMMLTGCAAPPPNVDYGPPPTNFQAPIKAYFDLVLKDPESARYRFGPPVPGYSNAGLIYGGGVAHVGYIVDVAVNAKNSFGGYTGNKFYSAVFERGQLVDVFEGINHPLVTRVSAPVAVGTAPSSAPAQTVAPTYQPLMR